MSQINRIGLKYLALCFLLLIITPISFASNWQKLYMADEFGDPDYSKPVYELIVDPIGGYGATVTFSYIQGLFVMGFTDAHVILDDVKSIKAKSSTGTVYDIPFEQISHEPAEYRIPKEGADILLDLLETGYFSLSVKTPVPFAYGEYTNHAFKIGTQGQGIKRLTGVKSVSEGKAAFKGQIGDKYSITVQFDQTETVFENGGTLTGIYWYGNGSNGKMKLKGAVDYLGRIELEEYDPQGKKCGEWYLNTVSSDDGMKYVIDGVMTNLKGQTFSVVCEQQ